MYYAHLPQRGLLSLTGDDTVDFLQGLISNDAARLRSAPALYAALLSPQGKYMHDFFLFPRGGKDVWVDAEKARLSDLHKRLSVYKLRSKVSLDVLPESQGVVAVWGLTDTMPALPQGCRGAPDPRLPDLGWRITGNVEAILAWCEARGFHQAGDIGYDIFRLQAGVPDGSNDMKVDKSLLLEYWFEELHGVDFAKGCYVGQEVTARSKHRAQLKKFLYQVTSLADELPDSGTPIMSGEVQVGEILSHAAKHGLALVRHEDYLKCQPLARPCEALGVPVQLAPPRWSKLPSVPAAS